MTTWRVPGWYRLTECSTQALQQRLVPGRLWAEALLEKLQQQATARAGRLPQAQCIDSAGFRGGQTVRTEQRQQFAASTASAYTKQWNIGQRTLLDVLDAEAERIDSSRQLITTEYDRLYAQYRILNGTGELIPALQLQYPQEGGLSEESATTAPVEKAEKPAAKPTAAPVTRTINIHKLEQVAVR